MKMHIEIEVEVHYDVQPFEPQTQTDPGCPAEMENLYVSWGRLDITDLLSKSEIKRIETQIWVDLAAAASGDNEP